MKSMMINRARVRKIDRDKGEPATKEDSYYSAGEGGGNGWKSMGHQLVDKDSRRRARLWD